MVAFEDEKGNRKASVLDTKSTIKSAFKEYCEHRNGISPHHLQFTFDEEVIPHDCSRTVGSYSMKDGDIISVTNSRLQVGEISL